MKELPSNLPEVSSEDFFHNVQSGKNISFCVVTFFLGKTGHGHFGRPRGD